MGEWFKDWFASEEYLNVYSHRNSEDADSLIKLILANIKIPLNASILDAPCGNGRHSEILSKLGYNVFGFDLSRTLIKIAQENKSKNNSKVNYFCSDIRNIPIEKLFNVIINLFTSFGYFNNDDENSAIIEFAKNNLKDNGYFIFDYLNPEFVKSNLVENSERNIGNKRIIEKRRIANNRVEKEIIIDDKFNNRYLESVQLYSFKEILTMFQNFGFYKIKVFGNYFGDKYSENNSERMIIIFQK